MKGYLGMRKLMLVAASVMALGAVSAAHAATTLYYGGDIDPNNPNANGLANEFDAVVNGAATYDNFTVTGGTWHVTGLFTNNQTNLNNITSANWEIRTGVSQGNGGTLLYSGSATPVVTPTGRNAFGLNEYQVEVPVSLSLSPGIYWMSVQPVSSDPGDQGRSFESNSFGLNAIGVHTADNDYFNSSFFGANFDKADNWGGFPAFSSGVLGTIGTVPEPTTWAMLMLGVAAIGFAVRRRNAGMAVAA